MPRTTDSQSFLGWLDWRTWGNRQPESSASSLAKPLFKDGNLFVSSSDAQKLREGARFYTAKRPTSQSASSRARSRVPLHMTSAAPQTPNPLDEILRQPDATLPNLPGPPVDIGPSLEELLRNPSQAELSVRCADEFATLRPITAVTTRITATPGVFPPECTLVAGEFVPRDWTSTRFTWKASGLCHKPLYFEQRALERYGHSCGPLLSPVLSGAHFFACVPLLPYNMGMDPPWECQYSLGYYRPGSCAPYMIYPMPISLRGLLAQGGIATALVFLIP